MKYSDKTNGILVRWQQAKMGYDFLDVRYPDSVNADAKTRAARSRILSEYFSAKQDLKNIVEPELVEWVKQACPRNPDVNLKTCEGYALWCKLERDMLVAQQKLFEISLEVADLFPHLSKTVQ